MTGPRGAGVGSLPGVDVAAAVRMLRDATPDLLAFPELPDRGRHAGMLGRGLALTDSDGVAARRARSVITEDLDRVEEALDGERVALKLQVVGPWTLAAGVALGNGEPVVSDHGARRDLAEALAHGLAEHVAEVRQRLEPSELVVQIDEPSLPVVAGSVEAAELSSHLVSVVKALRGVSTVVHCCASQVPVSLLAGAGFGAISFDLSLAVPDDAWAEVCESGVELWPGGIRNRESVGAFFGQLGFEPESFAPRLVVTPPCGLAGFTPSEARAALEAAQRIGSTYG